MKKRQDVNMKYLLILATLTGCATSIDSTLKTAQQECDEYRALISNMNGIENVKVKCTWTVKSGEDW